jgi:hypothetical protein
MHNGMVLITDLSLGRRQRKPSSPMQYECDYGN